MMRDIAKLSQSKITRYLAVFLLLNAFAFNGSGAARTTATGKIVQYATEDSGADPIKAMMAVQSAADLVGTYMSKFSFNCIR